MNQNKKVNHFLKKNKMENEVRHLLSSSEFCCLGSGVEKVVKLVQEYHMSQRAAAKICCYSQSSIQRRLVAIKKGRQYGISGRPKLLSEVKTHELIE